MSQENIRKPSPLMQRGGTPRSTTPIEESDVDSKRYTDAVQDELQQMCLVRDQGCVITGNPIPEQLKCAHILTPSYAVEWDAKITRKAWRPSFLWCSKPTVQKTDGTIMWTPAYDVKNAITLDASLHNGFNRYTWSIVKVDGEYRTFAFSPGAVADTVVNLPPKLRPGKYENYYVEHFPLESTFEQHFCEAVSRNFVRNYVASYENFWGGR
ncbi:hypothetical protein DFS34DRAFT_334243 [Phlyctochytrium arcticum]|nr:hypothetical protein DFS34DRAFT_334243 [Phlyctochytrium arcticum]